MESEDKQIAYGKYIETHREYGWVHWCLIHKNGHVVSGRFKEHTRSIGEEMYSSIEEIKRLYRIIEALEQSDDYDNYQFRLKSD